MFPVTFTAKPENLRIRSGPLRLTDLASAVSRFSSACSTLALCVFKQMPQHSVDTETGWQRNLRVCYRTDNSYDTVDLNALQSRLQ